jgi:hypothetical protein
MTLARTSRIAAIVLGLGALGMACGSSKTASKNGDGGVQSGGSAGKSGSSGSSGSSGKGGSTSTGSGGKAGGSSGSGSSGSGGSSGGSSGSGAGSGAWFCAQANDACSCVMNAGASGDMCTKPKPTCCFTIDLASAGGSGGSGAAGLGLACQCWPAGSSTCTGAKQAFASFKMVSTCPPP